MVLKARRAMMEAIGTVLVSRTGGGEAGLLSGGAALELGLGVPLAAHTIDFVKTELPWLGIQYYVRQAAWRELSVDQLLAAAIPAGVLGGFCAGAPFACSSASRPPPDPLVLHAAARTGGA